MKFVINKILNLKFISILALTVYFLLICFLNLSVTPDFYDSDMYADILFVQTACEEKSLFPQNWVFGNQLYVVATPALAVLICLIIKNPIYSMAIASSIMSAGVIISFVWMLKPVFKKIEHCTISCMCLIAFVALCGDAVYRQNGLQLLFTMCSYYSCYAITAFLCFGCYIRRNDSLNAKYISILLFSLFMSLGCGIQSLRQTAVMIVPLITVEFLNVLREFVKNKKIPIRSIVITLSIVVSNIIGLIVKSFIKVNQNEIFGEVALDGHLVSNARDALEVISSLITPSICICIGFVIIASAVLFIFFSLFKLWKSESEESLHLEYTVLLLHAVSIVGVFALNVITTLSMRDIYYFMFYPFLSIVVVFGVFRIKKIKGISIILLSLLFVSSLVLRFTKPVWTSIRFSDGAICDDISEMLQENGYTTLYANYDNNAEDIAVASKGKIQVAYWFPRKVLFPVDYICNLNIYMVHPDECVYMMSNEEIESAINRANELGCTFTLLAEFPESNIYLYTASENLMESNLGKIQPKVRK